MAATVPSSSTIPVNMVCLLGSPCALAPAARRVVVGCGVRGMLVGMWWAVRQRSGRRGCARRPRRPSRRRGRAGGRRDGRDTEVGRPRPPRAEQGRCDVGIDVVDEAGPRNAAARVGPSFEPHVADPFVATGVPTPHGGPACSGARPHPGRCGVAHPAGPRAPPSRREEAGAARARHPAYARSGEGRPRAPSRSRRARRHGSRAARGRRLAPPLP